MTRGVLPSQSGLMGGISPEAVTRPVRVHPGLRQGQKAPDSARTARLPHELSARRYPLRCRRRCRRGRMRRWLDRHGYGTAPLPPALLQAAQLCEMRRAEKRGRADSFTVGRGDHARVAQVRSERTQIVRHDARLIAESDEDRAMFHPRRGQFLLSTLLSTCSHREAWGPGVMAARKGLSMKKIL